MISIRDIWTGNKKLLQVTCYETLYLKHLSKKSTIVIVSITISKWKIGTDTCIWHGNMCLMSLEMNWLGFMTSFQRQTHEEMKNKKKLCCRDCISSHAFLIAGAASLYLLFLYSVSQLLAVADSCSDIRLFELTHAKFMTCAMELILQINRSPGVILGSKNSKVKKTYFGYEKL